MLSSYRKFAVALLVSVAFGAAAEPWSVIDRADPVELEALAKMNELATEKGGRGGFDLFVALLAEKQRLAADPAGAPERLERVLKLSSAVRDRYGPAVGHGAKSASACANALATLAIAESAAVIACLTTGPLGCAAAQMAVLAAAAAASISCQEFTQEQ